MEDVYGSRSQIYLSKLGNASGGVSEKWLSTLSASIPPAESVSGIVEVSASFNLRSYFSWVAAHRKGPQTQGAPCPY